MNNEDNSRMPSDPGGLPRTSPSAEAPRGESTERSAESGAERDLQKALWEDLDEGRRFAKEQVEQVKTDVTRKAEGQKNVAARQLSGVGTAIEKVGAELEQSDRQAIGRYAKQIGSSLQKFARDMEGRSLREIAAVAEDFGRRQPLAFLGLAAIAGLSASRFLVASSERRTAREPSGQTSGQSPSPARPRQIQEELRNG
ncbi:nutrient deprivation-induced protein [Ensifer sp. NBAIM29]|nr:nutrient deprivation-induced protein [Ensifer sp. NBAIM29]MCG5481309.1 nutrient deprivation-induced protein [Sinorhizobium alkalisoli]